MTYRLSHRWNSALISRVIAYLSDRSAPLQVPLIFLLGFLYEQLTGLVARKVPLEYSRWIITVILLGLVLLSLKPSRGALYAILALVLAGHIFFYTAIISRDVQDSKSSRDDALEMTTQAFLRGENPWNHVEELGVPATTGPASILAALPFVYFFGHINWLTALFWLAFFAILLGADVYFENNTFPLAALVFVLGLFSFTHTLFWSLEELFFPVLMLPLIYWAAKSRRYFWVGFLLGVMVMVRLNYLFVALAILLWLVYRPGFSPKKQGPALLGGLAGIGLVLLPFVLVGGREFWSANPLITAFSMSASEAWPHNNFLFEALNRVGSLVGDHAMRLIKLLFTALILWLAAIRLKRIEHPFWHVTAAAFLAQTIAWLSAAQSADYELFFILPALLALAWTRKTNATSFQPV